MLGGINMQLRRPPTTPDLISKSYVKWTGAIYNTLNLLFGFSNGFQSWNHPVNTLYLSQIDHNWSITFALFVRIIKLLKLSSQRLAV